MTAKKTMTNYFPDVRERLALDGAEKHGPAVGSELSALNAMRPAYPSVTGALVGSQDCQIFTQPTDVTQ